MQPAPFLDDVADGPGGAQAFWLQTRDRVRLRMVHWPTGPRGRVLLFPGRTEPAEKYGPVARWLAVAGFGASVIDWRCQGLSERLADDPLLGVVDDFADYQHDVGAFLEAVTALDHGTAPTHLLAHSMGGTIALRALTGGMKLRAVAFSAPMWGLRMGGMTRAGARVLSRAGRLTRRDLQPVPGNPRDFHLWEVPFDDNMLTTDRARYGWMQAQLHRHPMLRLGPPSLRWLGAALRECRALARLRSPDVPALAGLGSREKIVDPAAVELRMARWRQGHLQRIGGAEHELLMEAEALRQPFLDAVLSLFRTAD